ncbi:eyes absent homolog isoform X2 [Juglans microcarpa x Juglans regia]|uniref:eyes absent homolog isoform X2 n=1 Tax=Juglans microcarpa x Juglans regia TaxID=2249226 RepID=UPI001B7DCFE4|nr:eyes absent homolog isoform X2 [Juglans microcarpa x Juglans regia]
MGDNLHVPHEETKGIVEDTVDGRLDVYIWDMDETLILLKSLLNGMYAEAFNGLKDAQKGVEIGKMWEKHILDLCDSHFFYEQGLHNFFDQEAMKLWDELYDVTDKYTDRWLSSARAFLEQCLIGKKDATSSVASAVGALDSPDSNYQQVNVLVTSGSLIPSLVKCLLFRLDGIITHGNVYSSWEVGKVQCFQWIKERFSCSNVRFCVIGDGWEECEAAQAMRWPFVKIDLRPGSSHRFPGLTLRTVGYYFSVVYGSPDAEDDKD